MKRPENKSTKKPYPIMPYLVGLFVTVIVLVLLSYLVGLRNRDELHTYEAPQNYVSEYSALAV
jgi:hypothetical protein